MITPEEQTGLAIEATQSQPDDIPPALMGEATYCPEDDKLRLYVGRVSRPDYEKLRADGWTSTPKQSCDFVAVWTPERRDLCLEWCGVIDDEDASPAERAADRAERFAGYREKRTAEAVGHADRFDAGPSVFGYQSQARAERAAVRFDRVAARACDSWGKAEYWQRRTAGVISHALYKSTPAVRMGRIKELEAELRKQRKGIEERQTLWQIACAIRDEQNADERARRMLQFVGSVNIWSDYMHPRAATNANPYRQKNAVSLYGLMTDPVDPIAADEAIAFYFSNHCEPATETDWTQHLEMRLAYENQMLEAAGGRAAFVEMEVGGFIGSHQIYKVNKSSVTGRVVSVLVMGTRSGFSKASGYTKHEETPCLVSIETERLPADAYRAPTPEELAAFKAARKAEKEVAPKKEVCPLINPTDEDAEKLQAIWNADERSQWAKPMTPLKTTFAQYEGRGAVKVVCETGKEHRTRYGDNITRSDVFKVRTVYGDNYSARRVVILTDKPQKGIPWDALKEAAAKAPTVEKMRAKLGEIRDTIIALQGYRQRTHEEHALLRDAEYVGWVSIACSSPQWTDAGMAELKRHATTANA